ncbi:MAG: ABC transporter permease subunit [Mariprofundaceae bacterium]|nr:ABC transporter permease subunit [Mariprofundaceae bacterium]
MSLAWLQIRALCFKEWRVLLDTPLGYVIAIAFLFVNGFFFEMNLFLFGQADMRAWFYTLALVLMFFIPAMAMRMLADETRSGTFELLVTMPVSTSTIVLGKFLALWMQILCLLALTLLYPLTLSCLGNLDIGQVLASYLAVVLLASSYASVCLYASAMTRYEVVAYISGFIMLLLLFLLSKAIPSFSPVMQNWLFLLSPLSHYQSMLRGLIRLSDVMFFIAMSSVFLSLTWFELERRRWR